MKAFMHSLSKYFNHFGVVEKKQKQIIHECVNHSLLLDLLDYPKIYVANKKTLFVIILHYNKRNKFKKVEKHLKVENIIIIRFMKMKIKRS